MNYLNIKYLSKKIIYSVITLCLLCVLQACTTVEYQNNLAEKQRLEKEIDSIEYKQKEEKLINLQAELEAKQQEKEKLESEFKEKNKFLEFFDEKMEYEKQNFDDFNKTFYNHTYNINLIDSDNINQSYLIENNIYSFQYGDKLIIDKIVDANSIEIKSPFKINDIVATDEVNSKITIDNNEDHKGEIKWESSKSKNPKIIISNYNTKNVLINTQVKRDILFKYKGVSKDGKYLLFESVYLKEYIKNAKNKEDYINWLGIYLYRNIYNRALYGDYYFISFMARQEELKRMLKKKDIFKDANNKLLKSLKLSGAKWQNILEKNIYYINSQQNSNVIEKEYKSYNFDEKYKIISEKQEVITNLTKQIENLQAELQYSDALENVKSSLNQAGYHNFKSYFIPSNFSKYTIGVRRTLYPYSVVGSIVYFTGATLVDLVLVGTAPLWIWFV